MIVTGLLMEASEICEALARGEPVQLRDFGSFNVRAKRGRIGRNPKTGVEALITPRRVLSFTPSPFRVARLNCETVVGRGDKRECSKGFSAYVEPLV